MSIHPVATGFIYSPAHPYRYEIFNQPEGAMHGLGLYMAVAKILDRLVLDDRQLREWVLCNPPPADSENSRQVTAWYKQLMARMLEVGFIFFDRGNAWARSEDVARQTIRDLPYRIVSRLPDWNDSTPVKLWILDSTAGPIVTTWGELRGAVGTSPTFTP